MSHPCESVRAGEITVSILLHQLLRVALLLRCSGQRPTSFFMSPSRRGAGVRPTCGAMIQVTDLKLASIPETWRRGVATVGLYPIVTFQYSSTTL